MIKEWIGGKNIEIVGSLDNFFKMLSNERRN